MQSTPVTVTCADCGGSIEVDVALGEMTVDSSGTPLIPVTGSYDHQCPATGKRERGVIP